MTNLRSKIAGSLFSYMMWSIGLTLVLSIYWAGMSPKTPSPAAGFIFKYNIHGGIRYLSAFEATSLYLLFVPCFPAMLICGLLTPQRFWSNGRFIYDPDPYEAVRKRFALVSAILSPIAIVFIGSSLVKALNRGGIVLSMG